MDDLKKNVGFIGPLSPVRGGISHYNDLFVEGLRESGYNTIPISYKQLYPKFLFPGTSEIDPNAKPVEGAFHILKAWNPLTWFKAKRILKKNNVQKLILIHWHPFFSPVLAFLARQKYADGSALFVHNALPHENRWLGKLLNPILYKSVDKIWIGSEKEAKHLKVLAPNVPYEVIIHPVHDRFSASIPDLTRSEAKEKIGYDANKPLLMHLGLVREYKGVDILIKAMSEIRNQDVFLEVAGEFYDDQEKYDQLVETLSLKDKVKINNKYLSDMDMAYRLRAADAVVLPYRNATQSGVAMISLACGTPVIASKVGMLAEVLNSPVYGELVEPEKPTALAEAIDRFLQEPSDIRESKRPDITKNMQIQFGTWASYTDRIVKE